MCFEIVNKSKPEGKQSTKLILEVIIKVTQFHVHLSIGPTSHTFFCIVTPLHLLSYLYLVTYLYIRYYLIAPQVPVFLLSQC